MATKPDAAKPEAAKLDAEEPRKAAPKGKKLVILGGIAVLVLALAAGVAWFFLSKKAVAADDADFEEVVHVAPKGPPTYLPLDNMVVNLADPGGEKVAQIGITLELVDAKAVDQVKMYLPTIRSGILLIISQRTAEELLLIEGKEKLAANVLLEASRPFGGGEAANAKAKKDAIKPKQKVADKAAAEESPVRAVHFSSFIVQ